LDDPHAAEGLALRRKRVRWRAWHRGIRELDLILGRFADARLAGLDGGGLDAFEALLDVPDQEALDWLTGAAEPPAPYRTPLFAAIVAFHQRVGEGR
jgi:antitoxin CptB